MYCGYSVLLRPLVDSLIEEDRDRSRVKSTCGRQLISLTNARKITIVHMQEGIS